MSATPKNKKTSRRVDCVASHSVPFRTTELRMIGSLRAFAIQRRRLVPSEIPPCTLGETLERQLASDPWPVMRREMAGKKLDRIINGELKAPIICRLFDETLWSRRDDTLRDLDLQPIPPSAWHEVSRDGAVELLTNILQFDLCYETKRFSKSDARAIARDFVDRLHWQSRYFTNSEIPWCPGLRTWALSGLSSDSTLDTGVIVKAGTRLVGILWTFSWD